ncbi:hypothetical protein DHEL01_v212636 [Diaporthe helianthi]|uniref:Uncharacterized protein n=1 Tax=Diaporthe helianthi TaxID=158607 RepID=A0A2P5HFD7_DIAHE|nr:hypothetical protein DHEL01_v212636 [Diaporthe helianthi]
MIECSLTQARTDWGPGTEVVFDDPEQSDSTNSYSTNSSRSGKTNSSTNEDSNLANSEDDNSTASYKSIPGVGKFQIEKTSSDSLKCGMYALEISTGKQLAGDTLTPKVFNDIFLGPEMKAFNKKRMYRNRKEFHDDQLAYVLEIWGRRKGYDTLQLGVVLDGSFCYIIGADDKYVIMDSEAVMQDQINLAFTTIWIHSDNKEFLEDAEINHFSGVTLLEVDEEQAEARKREAEKSKEKAERQKVVYDGLKGIRGHLVNRRPQEQEEPPRKRVKRKHGY